MTRPIRIAILFSGGGSNMKALAAHISQPHVPAQLVMTISNRPDAGGIDYCHDAQIPCQIIDHKAYENRADFDAALDAALKDAEIDLICAAGFMRLLTPEFVTKWTDRILNIHPALLPKFKGLNTHARAIEAGESEHGCSVHYMRPEMDEGPILVQKSVPVLPDDTPESLAARVLEQEHIAYPEALDMALATLTT